MTYYLREITRINRTYFANQAQLNTVIATRHYIDQHFYAGLNLDLLSQHRFTSKFHLLRLFKRYYGQTPKQYLIEKRLQHSKQLLIRGYSPTETCFEIGLESPCSFSTLFKSRFGESPKAFQKRAISAKSL